MSLTLTNESYHSNTKNDNYGLDSLIRTTDTYSYLAESIQFCNEMNKMMNESQDSFIKSIMESDNSFESINESVEEFNRAFKLLIAKFIEHMKSMFDSFSVSLQEAVGKLKSSDLDAKIKLLDNFDNANNFNIDAYKFTIENNIPVMLNDNGQRTRYQILTARPVDFHPKNGAEIINTLKNLVYNDDCNKDLENDALRAMMKNDAISVDNYKEIAPKLFRNGKTNKEVFNINKTTIKDAINKINNFESNLKNAKESRDSAIEYYKKVKFDEDSSVWFDNNIPISEKEKEEIINLHSRVIKNNIQLNKMFMQYFSYLFAVKLTAIKEDFIQSRAILSLAISAMKKSSSNTKTECATCGCEDNLGFSVTIDTMEKLDPEDMINIVISDDDKENPVEIPINNSDVDKKEIEEAFHTLNAIEFQEISEKVNSIIEDKEYASLVKIESANNPHFGADILSNIYKNRVRNLSEATLEADKTVCLANNDMFQYIFSGNENKPEFGIYDILIRANDLYIKQVNDRLNDLCDSDLNNDADYVEEAMIKFSYLDSLVESSRHTKFIKECLLMASDKPSDIVMQELAILNEDATQSFQTMIDKIKDFFVNIWNTFINRVKYFFDNNKKYLENNHDTIINNKPTFSVSMKDYPTGIQNLKQIKIPKFDLTQLGSVLDSEEEFQAYVMKNTRPGLKPGDDFATYCINVFTGGPDEKQLNASELNMQNIFDYCNTYNEMQNELSEDQRNILSALDEEKRQLIKNINTAKVNKASGTATPTDNSGSEPAPQPPKAAKPNNEGYVFTESFGYVSINELEIIKPQETNQQKADDKAKAAEVAKNAPPESQDDVEKTKVDANDAKSIKKAVTVYNNVAKTVFSAKLKAAEEIYNDYMKIIKTHVDNNKAK